jgi:hypothetical protein
MLMNRQNSSVLRNTKSLVVGYFESRPLRKSYLAVRLSIGRNSPVRIVGAGGHRPHLYPGGQPGEDLFLSQDTKGWAFTTIPATRPVFSNP